MPDLLDLGWLPDAIVRAIVVFIRSVLVTVINFMFNFGLKPLLTIEPSIMTSGPVITAWDDVFRLSIALLPILIAAGLIAMPFSQDQEASLWNMVARLVAVIFFIAISQPLFGFLVEASNAVTSALAPPTFVLTFEADLGGGWGSTLGVGVEVVALLVAVILMFIATILSTVLLVLRQFIVVTVAVGAPFFAVLWFANWGPMKSISNFASTWLRMGVYALLVGPIIALVMRVFNVIGAGGISSSGDVAQFYASAALALIFPIVLFVVVWKTVGWAGQPLGVDAAFTMTVAAAIAATGVGAVAVGAGAGSGAVSGASRSSAEVSGESGSGPSSDSSGSSSGSGTAADPSATSGNSTIGGTMRSSISDTLGTQEPPVENWIDPAAGSLSKKWDYTRQRVAGAPKVETARSQANSAKSIGKKVGSMMKSGGLAGGRLASGSTGIDSHRKTIGDNMEAAVEADSNRDFLTEAYQKGEFDVPEAAERGILTESEEPAEEVSMVTPDAEGKVTYATSDGGETTIDLNDRAQKLGQTAETFRNDASRSARSVKRIRAAQTAAKTPGRVAISTGQASKQIGKTGVRAGKAGGIIFGGAMTQSPYAAYNMGKRGGEHLIGPGTVEEHSDSSEAIDIDEASRSKDRLDQSSEPPWDKDARGGPSEKM